MRGVTARVAWLVVEAVWISAYVRLALVVLPFRRARRWLGELQDASTPIPRTIDGPLVRDVKRAVGICNRYAFWTNCYSLSLTAKKMLARRGVATTLFIGVKRDDPQKLAAHAWLMNGDTIVAGDGDLSAFTVHGRYG